MAKTICALRPRPRDSAELGEGAGHSFRGNQHTGGIGGSERTPSLRQSEERIRKALPNAEVDLQWHFEKFGMRVSDVPPVPMDRKLADITAERIEKFAAEFPEAAATIAGVNMAEGASGYAQTDFSGLDGDPVISLNPDFYPSEKTLQEGLTDPSWVGVAVATPEGVIDHELGHVLDFSRDAAYVDRLRGPGYYSGRTETFNEPNMGKISEYAAQGGPEAFAEVFALHQGGADIPVAKAERAIDSAVREAEQPHSNDHAPAVAASGMVGGHTCEGFGPPPKTKRANLSEGAGHPFHGNQHTGGLGRGEGDRGYKSPTDVLAGPGRQLMDELDPGPRIVGNATVAKAEARIAAVIGGNLGPMLGGLPVDERINLSTMEPQLATEVADRVEAFAKEFPEAADRIGAMVETGSLGSALADTNVSPDGDLAIRYNALEFASADILRGNLEDPDNSTAIRTSAGVTDHELGHVLDVMAPTNGTYQSEPMWELPSERSVSAYAASNPREAVAEAFSVRQAGQFESLPPDVARQLKDVTDEARLHPGEDRKEQASVFAAASVGWHPVCSGYPGKRITSYAAVQPLAFGEAAGHAFRGNQWTGGSGLADAISRMDPSIFYEERMRQLNPAQQAELRQLTKDLSTWDLASWQERIAARDSGADWYQRLDRFAAESPPVSETLYRGTGQEVTEGEHISMPLSNWSTDRDTSSEYIRSEGTKTGSLLVLPPSQEVHAFDASLIDKDPPPMFNYMAAGDFVVTSKSDTGQAILAPAPRTASAEFGDSPGHPFRGNQYRGGEGGAIVTNGVAWMTSQKTPEEKAAFHERLGNCYPLSGQYVTSHPDATLVHGTIQGMGFPPNPHAWIENADGTIHEPASDRNWTPDAFKDYFHPVENDRYSSHDAARMMVGTGHYGPWTDQERKTAEFGEGAGHPFRGNQWTDIGHGGIETRAIHYVEQLYNGEKVSIPADQVATVLDVIGRQAADAKAGGREARDINLCNASVEGANMFCSDSFGIPRQDMAQLAGDVVPGSQAALDNPGEKNIDATDKFLDSLRDQGVPFTKDVVPAQELKATQDELNGAKVAGIMNADMLDQERLFREPLVVSKENYILDGHHRWAAGIGLEYMDGKLDSDVTANVYRVDAPITELMTDAKSFATSYGIKSEGIKSFTKGGNFSVVQVQILEFGEGHGHAFRGNQHTGGIGGEHDQLPLCPPSCHERELAVLHRDNLAIDGKFGDEMRPTNLQFEHTPERMGQWAPEREKLHNEIVANALRAAEERGVPQDSQMVLMGGLPGAGKSSATEDILDPKDWIMISPDDVKLQLAERGDIPTPDGMKAMEASPLVGDEAMKVSWDLADQATAQGYNVVWDMTGDDASWYSERIQNAQSTLPESEPYKTTGIFVDVPIDQSKDQVSSRYAKGAESTYGGRPVPQDYIERSRDPQYGSTQRRAFEESRSLLDQVMVIDNTDHKQQVVEKTPGFTLD